MWQCKYFAIFCWILWMETISICGQGDSQGAARCPSNPHSVALERKNIKFTKCSSRKSGDKCTVECKNGFKIGTDNQNSTTQHINCIPPSWSTKELEMCISIPTILKCESYTYNNGLGVQTCGNTSLNSICLLTCSDRYKLEGKPNSVICSRKTPAIAEWSSTTGKCVEKRCSWFYRDRRGVKCTKDNKIDSQCTLSCGVGSYVNGKNPIVCRQNSDGSVSWDGSVHSCKPIPCKPYTYNNGVNNIKCPNKNLGFTCSVECANGYRFEGENNSVICSNTSKTTAKWSRLNGACVGSVCVYKCDDGYEFANEETKKTVRCKLVGKKATWSPAISSIGSCHLKILKHRSCQYWISNIKAKNRGDANKKCKELLGSESVLAVTASASVKNFLYKNIKGIYKKEDPYLIGANKSDNGKWIWDNKEKINTELSPGKCAVFYENKIASESCSQKFICEKPTDSLNDICSPNPCQKGKCKPYGCSYKCTCENNFYERHCDSGPMTVEFEKNIYSASQNQKVTINVTMNTNRGGKASLDLYQNGDEVETYEINAVNSTRGAQPDYKQYTIENVKENIYVSARGTLQTDTGDLYLYVCAKIMPREATRKIEDVRVSKDQCNATNLLVSWDKLTSTAQLSYTIYVGDVKTYSSTHEETSHILSGLERNKKYTIKIVPDIKGCKNKLDLFDPYEGETAEALPGAPEKVNLRIAEKNCQINWKTTHHNGFGGYQVRMSETARSSSSMDQNKKQQYKELTLKNSASKGYSFMTNPNSIYMFQIGTIPTEDCKERVPIAWSDEITGCSTDTAPPGKVKTPTADLSLIQDQTVPVTLSPIDERNGPISCYFVVIKMLNSSENENNSKPITDVSFLKQGNETINVGDHFVSIALKRFQTEQNFRLGTGEMSFCDMRGLINNTKKKLTSARIIRASPNTAVHANNHKLNLDAEYSHFLLVSTPSLDGGEPTLAASDYSPTWSIKKDLAEETNLRGSNKTLEIILPIAVVVLLAVVLGALYLYKRKHPKTQEQAVSPENITLRRNIVANQVEEREYAEIAKYDDIGQAKESPDSRAA